MSFDNIELKTKEAEAGKTKTEIPDELKGLLAEALSGASKSAARAKCLEMAFKLNPTTPEAAVAAAEVFMTYILGEDK